MTSRTATAQDRRNDALGAIGTTLLDPAADYSVRENVTRATAADEIAKLASLGRTDRWSTAISKWVGMISDEGNDLRWAILQGQIGALHAND